MAVSLASLRTRFPEFAPTDDGVLQAALDAAVAEIDPAVFGGKYDEAVTLLTAHKAGVGQFGQQARRDPKAAPSTGLHGATTYGVEYDALIAQCAGGFWVVGGWR